MSVLEGGMNRRRAGWLVGCGGEWASKDRGGLAGASVFSVIACPGWKMDGWDVR